MNDKILRQYIRSFIFEALEGPHISNVLSQDLASREQIGSLADSGEEDEISAHLIEPEVTPEDCYGPVPPIADDPGVFADPFTRDYHVLPTSTIKRG
jgi:hypothetical protein